MTNPISLDLTAEMCTQVPFGYLATGTLFVQVGDDSIYVKLSARRAKATEKSAIDDGREFQATKPVIPLIVHVRSR